jgi:hypothetical protein
MKSLEGFFFMGNDGEFSRGEIVEVEKMSKAIKCKLIWFSFVFCTL